MASMRRYFRNQQGSAVIEYSLLAGFAAIATMAGAEAIEGRLAELILQVTAVIDAVTAGLG